MLHFESDYSDGAHPLVIERLVQTNIIKTSTYGSDEFSVAARDKIRTVCNAPDAQVFFLVGGTQTNATVIDALIKPYQGVISPDTGHIFTHEAGAVEYTGHKIISVKGRDGEINSAQIEKLMKEYETDSSKDHLVMPALVYISQPTEYGTLYSLKEIISISNVCKKHNLRLYADGARLAYALASEENNVALSDMAQLCDAFYIGGTKCGALFGEAVVFPKPDTVPCFFTITKQKGALMAKGRTAGLQFDVLFTDDLYRKIGKQALIQAEKIKQALLQKGYSFAVESPTNQIFVTIENSRVEQLSNNVHLTIWEKADKNNTVIRLVTSWSTTDDEVEKLINLL